MNIYIFTYIDSLYVFDEKNIFNFLKTFFKNFKANSFILVKGYFYSFITYGGDEIHLI